MFKVNGLRTVVLTPQASPTLQALFERASDHFEQVWGHPPRPEEGEALFVDRPPGTAPEQVVNLGLYDTTDVLVGVLSFVRGYPDATTWFIGLLLFDPIARGQGYGASVVEAFCAQAWESGATRLRLAVGLNNDGARRFWARNGFHFVRKAETVGDQSGVPVEVYERHRVATV